MGSALRKPIDPNAPLVPPINIPVVPLSFAFILFNLGTQFVNLSNDLWLKEEWRRRKVESKGDASKEMQHDDPVFQAVAAYYYRKAIKTPTLLKVSVLLPLVLGTLSKFREFFYAVFVRNGSHPPKRRFWDVVGLFVFVANVLFAAKAVIPWERRMGSLWNGKDKSERGAVTTGLQREKIKNEMLRKHLTAVGLLVALLVQNAFSWKAGVLTEVRSLKVGSS
eukprot:TRINITY_DN1599_c0_g1_i1.p1 TRINITY_DN1599_c0_g1~~TRINITY_DN1599_c0_g1_i1.p1  ORF type:complete len:222 (+),score=85.93 TRINITY_DN1599_c0_g1_i1:83-748(+)